MKGRVFKLVLCNAQYFGMNMETAISNENIIIPKHLKSIYLFFIHIFDFTHVIAIHLQNPNILKLNISFYTQQYLLLHAVNFISKN